MAGALQIHENQMGELREVQFWFHQGAEHVPGLLYLPVSHEEPMPFVLIQHPGMGSKEDYFVADIARAWARRGWVCGGLDAPLHGERASADPMSLFRNPDRYPEIRAQFAAEVSTMLDLLPAKFPIDMARLGFVGYSMGSMLGIPAVARDGRFKAAAFCLVGEGGLAGSASGEDSDIARINAAVRVVGKLEDQLIPREKTESLYAALTGEKDLRWCPGTHFEIGSDVIKLAEEWMVSHL
ncbi:MAG TPA: hypothetical protein PKI89_08065 [Tepidiformaceae bacterium]|nr:hypothetical protein [Tepidiformaceae bacterium]